MGMFSDIPYDSVVEKLNTEIEKRKMKITSMTNKDTIKKENCIISGIKVAIKIICESY